MNTNYVDVTEISGELVSKEQIQRLCNRYFWAGEFCKGKDVLEVACGTGPGLGYLAKLAKSIRAGDYSQDIVDIAKSYYGNRIKIEQFDAQNMTFPDSSFDVVIIFEAIYYLPDISSFLQECLRVLRPDGCLLISTANKDLFDFTPSPHSYRYLGVREFFSELSPHGFVVECFGDTPIQSVSTRQKFLRPIKMLASKLGLIPKSMNAKKLLKRLVFGDMVSMPAEIDETTAPRFYPELLAEKMADTRHKVILCAVRKI